MRWERRNGECGSRDGLEADSKTQPVVIVRDASLAAIISSTGFGLKNSGARRHHAALDDIETIDEIARMYVVGF